MGEIRVVATMALGSLVLAAIFAPSGWHMTVFWFGLFLAYFKVSREP